MAVWVEWDMVAPEERRQDPGTVVRGPRRRGTGVVLHRDDVLRSARDTKLARWTVVSADTEDAHSSETGQVVSSGLLAVAWPACARRRAVAIGSPEGDRRDPPPARRRCVPSAHRGSGGHDRDRDRRGGRAPGTGLWGGAASPAGQIGRASCR